MTTFGPIQSSNPNEAPIKYAGEEGSGDNPVDRYFANKPKDEIGFDLQKKADTYYEYLMTSGRWRLYGRAYEYYYNGQQRNNNNVEPPLRGHFRAV